jgi:hypothetical protein
MKLVINKCYGGFSLSHEGVMLYAKLSGIKLFPYVRNRTSGSYIIDAYDRWVGQTDDPFSIHYMTKDFGDSYKWEDVKEEGNSAYFSDRDIPRDDPNLVKVVEKLGEKANGRCASLAIVDIPDDVEWDVEEYDGNEWVAEHHRTWG